MFSFFWLVIRVCFSFKCSVLSKLTHQTFWFKYVRAEVITANQLLLVYFYVGLPSWHNPVLARHRETQIGRSEKGLASGPSLDFWLIAHLENKPRFPVCQSYVEPTEPSSCKGSDLSIFFNIFSPSLNFEIILIFAEFWNLTGYRELKSS